MWHCDLDDLVECVDQVSPLQSDSPLWQEVTCGPHLMGEGSCPSPRVGPLPRVSGAFCRRCLFSPRTSSAPYVWQHGLWVTYLSYTLGYGPALLYFVPQIAPAWAIGSSGGCCVPLTGPYHCESLLVFFEPVLHCRVLWAHLEYFLPQS